MSRLKILKGLGNIFFVGLVVCMMSCASTSSKRSFGEVVDDSVLVNKVKVRLIKNKITNGLKVNVDAWKGIVTLKGRLNSQEQINKSIEIAESEVGVRQVKSYLVLKNEQGYGENHSNKKNSGNSSKIEEKEIGTGQAVDLDSAPRVTE